MVIAFAQSALFCPDRFAPRISGSFTGASGWLVAGRARRLGKGALLRYYTKLILSFVHEILPGQICDDTIGMATWSVLIVDGWLRSDPSTRAPDRLNAGPGVTGCVAGCEWTES